MIRHKPSFVVDDATGATFWPTNAGACFNATNARFRVAGVDLAALYASADNRYKLVVKDSNLKVAYGFIDVADSAEAAPTEVLADPTLNNAGEWNDDAANVTHDEVAGTATWDGLGAGNFASQTNISVTVGFLYKIQIVVDSITTGNLRFNGGAGTFQGTNPNITSADSGTTVIQYIFCTHVAQLLLYGEATCDAVISNISIKAVTHVGEDGVLIMSTKGGSTQSWTYQEAGIGLNDITTFEVQRATRHHFM